MTGILLSKGTAAGYREALAAAARAAGMEPRVLHLPDDPNVRLAPEERAMIEVAYLSRDIRFSGQYLPFGETLADAPNLKWVHFAGSSMDRHRFLRILIERGVRLTTSAGSNGEAVAQSALAGLLVLARNFPHWWAAQGRREWAPLRGEAVPRDLRGQTVVIIGLDMTGAMVARFCQALGMRVIGVRPTARLRDDPVDEMHAPAALPGLLPRCDWLALVSPLTPGTRSVIDAGTLARMPRGARLVSVAGGVVDEAAIAAALRSGLLGGAYLDVFDREPLPPDSPLWGLPNVIISAHAASASSGNEHHAAQIFLGNLVNWGRGRPLQNEVGGE